MVSTKVKLYEQRKNLRKEFNKGNISENEFRERNTTYTKAINARNQSSTKYFLDSKGAVIGVEDAERMESREIKPDEMNYTPANANYTPTPKKTASDYVTKDFTPNYSQMPSSKKYTSGGVVLGVEDSATSQSYATEPTPISTFERLERERYKQAVFESNKEEANLRAKSINRARELKQARLSGTLSGAELKEYYAYYPAEQPTAQPGKKEPGLFQKNVAQPISAGIREGEGLFALIPKVKVEKKALGFIPTKISYQGKLLENDAAITSGERQFNTAFQKGLYSATKTGMYVADMASAGLLIKGVRTLRTSKAAFETAKVGGTYNFFYKANQVGKTGKALNMVSKIGATTLISFPVGIVVSKVGEKAMYARRTIGLDMKQQSKEFREREEQIARQVGLAAGALSANVVSQASGATYVIADTVKKKAALTAVERGKNIFAAGFGEASTITYLAQEANEGKTIYVMAGSKNKLARGAEVVGLGVLGGFGASVIDYAIEAPMAFSKTSKAPKVLRKGAAGLSKGVEGVAYGTDPFEYPGDYLEASFRGGSAFEQVRPVRINTQADTFFQNLGKAKTTFQEEIKAMAKAQDKGLTKTDTRLALKEQSLIKQMQRNMVTQRTDVQTRTNVNTRTNVRIRTNVNTLADISQPSINTLVDIKPMPIVPVTEKVPVKENINIRENVPVQENIPVFIPNVPGFGLAPLVAYGSGLGLKAPKIKPQYKPSLLGIARGLKATRTANLSGLEIRGIPEGLKENKPKIVSFGALRLKPVKDGISMKFKVIKPKKKAFESVGDNMIKRMRSVRI